MQRKIDRFTLENGSSFYFSPITKEDVDEAQSICDECVGKNLYPKDEILHAIEAPDRFFCFLKNEKDEPVGYVYYYLTDQESIAEYAKLDVNLFRSVYCNDEKKVGKIQSVGLKEEYRKKGLAAQMIRFILKQLKTLSVEAVFIVCWKTGNIVPLEKALVECSFKYLAEAKKIWYDYLELICSYCNGRCLCDAKVYYKLLDGEIYNEN